MSERPQLNAFQKYAHGRTSLVLTEAETRDEAQVSREWLASTTTVDVEAWR